MLDGNNAADRRGQRADEGHADLDGPEKSLGLLLKPLDPPGRGIPALDQMPHPAFSQGNE